MIGFLKKPWWVGPIVAGLSVAHPSANKPAGPDADTSYEMRSPGGVSGTQVVFAPHFTVCRPASPSPPVARNQTRAIRRFRLTLILIMAMFIDRI